MSLASSIFISTLCFDFKALAAVPAAETCAGIRQPAYQD
jgi:hypothetical protein